METKGHAAIVTGGASGLGAAAARALAAAGAKVAVIDVNEKAATEVAADVKGIAVGCDVADSASAEAAVKKPLPRMDRCASSSIVPELDRPSALLGARDRCPSPILSASFASTLSAPST